MRGTHHIITNPPIAHGECPPLIGQTKGGGFFVPKQRGIISEGKTNRPPPCLPPDTLTGLLSQGVFYSLSCHVFTHSRIHVDTCPWSKVGLRGVLWIKSY